MWQRPGSKAGLPPWSAISLWRPPLRDVLARSAQETEAIPGILKSLNIKN